MNKPGVRGQRSVVNVVAQRGYDRVSYLERKKKILDAQPTRFCSLESCKVKLSKYNDTDFCAQHQRGNINLPKFL